MKRALLPLLPSAALLLVACGGSSADTTPDPEPTSPTAGGETETARVERPIRTTTPVPVPQPAVVREELSEPLQQVWTQIEEAVAIRPPEGPEEATEAAVHEWSEGPFREWIEERGSAVQVAVATSEDVPEDPPHERAVASALLGYALEDFVADVRGSPLPVDIAEDPELLEIYVANLMEVLRPIAIEAVISYAYCQRRLAALGDESEWLPWRAYCVQRGQEVIQTYELQPHEMQPGQAGEGDAEEPGEEGEAEEGEPGEGQEAEEGEPTSSLGRFRPRFASL